MTKIDEAQTTEETIKSWAAKTQPSRAKGEEVVKEIGGWGKKNRTDLARFTQDPARIFYRKPSALTYFRVLTPREEWTDFFTLEDKETRCSYLVNPALAEQIQEVKTRTIVQCVTLQGTHFLWGLHVPMPGKPTNEWTTSAWRIAELAIDNWVRMTTNMEAQQYTSTVCVDPDVPNPNALTMSLTEMIAEAFSDSIIHSEDDPFIQHLLGKVLKK